jgi:hypothetical protein
VPIALSMHYPIDWDPLRGPGRCEDSNPPSDRRARDDWDRAYSCSFGVVLSSKLVYHGKSMSRLPRRQTGMTTSRALVLAATALVLFSVPYSKSEVAASPPAPMEGTILGSNFVGAAEIAEARASLAAGFGPAAIATNGTWTDAVPTLTSLPEFAYDAADGYLVVFQGLVSNAWNSTWIYSHGNWTQLNESTAPINRFGASIAYDPADREVVLFGGFKGNNDTALNDTWVFQGGNWSKIPAAPTRAPTPRGYAAMSYDGQTSQLVLFGGEISNGCVRSCGLSFLNDTWTFGKGLWHRVHTGTGTPPRMDGLGMAYDPASGNLTMFGGFSENYTLYSNRSHPHPIRVWSSYPRNETWSFRAGTWRQVTGPGPASESSALIYVPGLNGTILFGNASEGTWKFANDTWTRLSVAAPPAGGPFAYDSALGEVARFGVTVSTFNGTNWTTPVNPLSAPASGLPLLAYDSRDGYVIGYISGWSQTWIFRNGTWSNITASSGRHLPIFRSGATFTYDAADNESILFGGEGWKFVATGGAQYRALNDTWVLRNGGWTNLHLTHSPPRPINSAVAAYDSHDKEVVLFGGSGWTQPFPCFCGPFRNQTWTFSAGNWKELNITGAVPAARAYSDLVDDPSAGGLLMFGGEEFSSTFSGQGNDTWLFSAGNWTRIPTPIAPSGRAGASMTYDSSKGEVLLFGGENAYCYGYFCVGYATPQVWAFKNSSWSLLNFGSQFLPQSRIYADFIYVPQEGYDLLFGGSGPIAVDDVWTLILS